jgi:hypothetical protein
VKGISDLKEECHARLVADHILSELPEDRSRALRVVSYIRRALEPYENTVVYLPRRRWVMAAGFVAMGLIGRFVYFGATPVEAGLISALDQWAAQSAHLTGWDETRERVKKLPNGEYWYVKLMDKKGEPFALIHVLEQRRLAPHEVAGIIADISGRDPMARDISSGFAIAKDAPR